MKKLFSIMLVMLMLIGMLASCNVASQDSAQESKSLYELAVEAGFEGTLEEWSLAVANVKDTQESKSIYELAVEAGFEGTLEEWSLAVANVKDTSESEITSADAIIIAQTHFFAVYANAENIYYNNLVTVALLSKEDSENWYIHIYPKDVVGDYDIDHKGGSHLYTISKKTGNIVNIKFGGE